jgi:hypothetical protein
MERNFKGFGDKILRISGIYQIFHPRKTHLYCVGTAKSGTTSIQAIFSERLRSGHETDSHKMMDLIIQRASGKVTDKELNKFIRKYDKRFWLEVDSSQLNYFIISNLVDLFPNAKFILTIRNPYAWVERSRLIYIRRIFFILV